MTLHLEYNSVRDIMQWNREIKVKRHSIDEGAFAESKYKKKEKLGSVGVLISSDTHVAPLKIVVD